MKTDHVVWGVARQSIDTAKKKKKKENGNLPFMILKERAGEPFLVPLDSKARALAARSHRGKKMKMREYRMYFDIC